MSAWRLIIKPLLGYTALALMVVLGALVVAQATWLARRIDAPLPWLVLIPRAVLALLPLVVPIAALIGAALTFAVLRRRAALIALAALGWRPARMFAPVVAVGTVLGGAALWIGAGPGPEAVGEIRVAAARAVATGWLPTGGAVELGGARVEVQSGLEGPVVWAQAGRVLVHGHDAQAGAGAIALRDAWVWSPTTRIRVDTLVLRMDPGRTEARLRALGAPHDRPTAGLGPGPDHRFMAARRAALPLLAPLWALLGALLAGRLGGPWSVLLGATMVAGIWWLLRTGELTARAGLLDPGFAASAPVCVAALLTGWAWVRLWR